MSFKILVVSPSWIGDTIMAQPLLMRLLERHPEAVIDVLAAPWSAPLFERMPQVRRTLDSPFVHGRLDWSTRRALGRRLAGENYDQTIVLPNSWKSALPVFFAGIPLRTGYSGEVRYLLLNDRRHLDEKDLPLLVERYAQLAEAPGNAMPRPLPLPRLESSQRQQQEARLALGLPEAAEPLVLCPGAEYGPAKRWPAHHFAALARQLASRDHPAWIIGSAKDGEIAARIEAQAEGCILNLCGRTDLAQAIDLIAGARAVVSNDSGLMHVAAALHRPLVALFGSSSPGYTPPLSPRARILTLALDCSPCFKRHCPLGHTRCLEDLTPDRIAAAIAELS